MLLKVCLSFFIVLSLLKLSAVEWHSLFLHLYACCIIVTRWGEPG